MKHLFSAEVSLGRSSLWHLSIQEGRSMYMKYPLPYVCEFLSLCLPLSLPHKQAYAHPHTYNVHTRTCAQHCQGTWGWFKNCWQNPAPTFTCPKHTCPHRTFHLLPHSTGGRRGDSPPPASPSLCLGGFLCAPPPPAPSTHHGCAQPFLGSTWAPRAGTALFEASSAYL